MRNFTRHHLSLYVICIFLFVSCRESANDAVDNRETEAEAPDKNEGQYDIGKALSEQGTLVTINWLHRDKKATTKSEKLSFATYWYRTLLTADAGVISILDGQLQLRGLKIGVRHDFESTNKFESDNPEASAFLTLQEAIGLRDALVRMDSLRTVWKSNGSDSQAIYDTGKSLVLRLEVAAAKDIFWAQYGNIDQVTINLAEAKVAKDFLELLMDGIGALEKSAVASS
jgi:hypothetical protein